MKQSRQENLIYLAVWSLLFVAPLLSLYVRTVSDANLVFDWAEVFVVWRHLAVFFVLFLVHNFLLAPLLIHGRKRVVYFSIVALVLVAFTLYQCNNRPQDRGHIRRRPHIERMDEHGQAPMEHGEGHRQPPMEQMGRHRKPPFDKYGRPHDQHRPDMPPPIIGEHDLLAILVLFLMFGANLGIKAYFRGREDRVRLAELEKRNLEQQLEYLRYQINPHFFMNTLNNIHALVDIDPAKAQETIVELSKMMRFVLYEGDKRGVPLTKELEFIRTYIKLMRLRYTDKVRITLDLPSEVPDSTIPPLMLISFVENAFKHGVSYQRESFIEVKIQVEGKSLYFSCRNSKADVSNEEKGGVGLVNVRKRLDLLFGNQYTLHISDDAEAYSVELNIPLS